MPLAFKDTFHPWGLYHIAFLSSQSVAAETTEAQKGGVKSPGSLMLGLAEPGSSRPAESQG